MNYGFLVYIAEQRVYNEKVKTKELTPYLPEGWQAKSKKKRALLRGREIKTAEQLLELNLLYLTVDGLFGTMVTLLNLVTKGKTADNYRIERVVLTDMNEKTRKFSKYLEEKDMDCFELKSNEDEDYFKHTENVNGMSIATGIIMDGDSCTRGLYFFAHCADEEKQKEILVLLNDLNVRRRLKYSINSDGAICASFLYWADDDEFEPATLMDLYLGFLRAILNDGDLNRVMKIIWG